jgi:predicted nucleic acid-binding protein
VRLYFDTAYVAKCYLNEPTGKEVRRLARDASALYTSMLSVAELACVFHRQVREGKLNTAQAAKWTETFLADVRDGVWTLLPVSRRILFRIESLARGLPLAAYLRAGDAIHLVSAVEAGFSDIWSNDRHLLTAAHYFGLEGRSV